MRLHELYIGEQVPYLQRPNSPYAKALADYLRLNPGKTEDDFKLLLPNQQNKYLDKYLEEGPVAKAIGTALLGLGLMGSPNVDAGPDSAAYKAGYDGVQSILSMPGKLFNRDKTAKDKTDVVQPFAINNKSQLDAPYEKVAYTTCETIAKMADKHFTKKMLDAGDTFYDITAKGYEQSPQFTIRDNGKGKGSCVFQFSSYKTADTGTKFDPVIYQTRQIQMVWNNYEITDVQYIANPKGTKPSIGMVTDPSDRSQALNLHNEKNASKRVAPKKITDITQDALAGEKINLKTMTDRYIDKQSAK